MLMLKVPRSMLFVSGERTERFPKAFTSGADVVCIDLEDAVHPAAKEEARQEVLAWLATQAELGSLGRAVRINAMRTRDGVRDALALADSGIRLDWLLLPKVEDAADVAYIKSLAGDSFRSIVALIETPQGVENALAIVGAIADLQGPGGALMLGGADLSAELGAEFGWEGLLYARGRLVNAARSRGLQVWDVPYIDVIDSEGLLRETRRVISLGFTCKTAIHPRQIEQIHEAFSPDPSQVKWANDLLSSQATGTQGAFLFQGKLVDAPIIKRAERIAALSAVAPTLVLEPSVNKRPD